MKTGSQFIRECYLLLLEVSILQMYIRLCATNCPGVRSKDAMNYNWQWCGEFYSSNPYPPCTKLLFLWFLWEKEWILNQFVWGAEIKCIGSNCLWICFLSHVNNSLSDLYQSNSYTSPTTSSLLKCASVSISAGIKLILLKIMILFKGGANLLDSLFS